MATYLLTWNPNRWPWETLQDDVRYFDEHGHLSYRWSCGNTKKILPNDRLFLIRLGKEPRGICASGWATSNVKRGPHWDERLAALGKKSNEIEMEFDALLDSDNEPVLPREKLNEGVFSRVYWDSQASGITIPDEVATQLELEWKRFYGRSQSHGKKFASRKIRSEYVSQLMFSEGATKEITVEIRKREPKLRVQAIAKHGLNCQVCGFNFGEYYGDIGEGFIEMHHLRPLSTHTAEHQTTVDDVRVVCANCHRVLHRNGANPLSLNELKNAIRHRK